MPTVWHIAGVAPITKRLEKRYAVEGDELARDALIAIRELREALQALMLDPANVQQARAVLIRHR